MPVRAKSGFVRRRLLRHAPVIRRCAVADGWRRSFDGIASWPAAFNAAKPRSRPALRSSTFSSPTRGLQDDAGQAGGAGEVRVTRSRGRDGLPVPDATPASHGVNSLRWACTPSAVGERRPKTFCRSTPRMAKTPSGDGVGPVSYQQNTEVGHQPLDPDRQSFCDATQLPVAAR